MISTSAPAWLSRALVRATRTATGSMSVASTRRCRARAAAMARTPLPVPRSSRRGAGCTLAPGAANPVECQEAAAGGTVMAGAERERRLDLDPDPVDRNAHAVVRAVNDKAPGRDRREAGETGADPVLLRHAREA